MLQYTQAPVTVERMWTTPNLVAPSVVINGLEIYRKYAFRVAPLFLLEEPEYARPVVSRYVE